MLIWGPGGHSTNGEDATVRDANKSNEKREEHDSFEQEHRLSQIP